MGELIVTLAGTPAGEALALAFALLSALSHAIFGAVNKGGPEDRSDPFLTRGAINVSYGLMAAPFALFVFPWPTPALWLALCATFFVHILYEWLQASSFEKGAFTLVYPIARGTGPLAAVALASIIFGERFGAQQWLGVTLLSGAIFAFAAANVRAARLGGAARGALTPAILTALATGVMIAVYTNVDAFGIRLAENPFTFLAWFFTMGAAGFPIIAWRRWRRLTPEQRPPLDMLAMRGVLGGLVAFVSFGALMLATRLDKVGEAAAIRETSIIFATAIGVLIFRERIDLSRLGLIGLIVLGAVLVELG